MPARRFFAMLNAAQKLKAIELLEQLDIAAVPLTSFKWYDHLKERYMARFDKASGFDPAAITPGQTLVDSGKLTEPEKAGIAFQQFALLKRVNGYG